jgi:serine/threonine protein kinase
MSPARDRIFLSYSHRDEHWRDEVQMMLKPMVRLHDIETWSDRQIEPGEQWRPKIDDALRRSRVAVLLVSKHFLNSKFILEHEFPAMLAMRDEGLVVHWMLVGNCPWEETELLHIQALHDTSRPLDSLSGSDRDLALKRVCGEVKRTLLSTTVPVQPLVEFRSLPKPMPPRSPPDDSLRANLLYAITAFNMYFITAERFTEICVRWNAMPTKDIRELLRERDIDETGDEEIERAVTRSLTRHGGNVSATLSAVADSTMRLAARQSRVPAIMESMDGLSDAGCERVVLPELSERYVRGPLHAPGKLGQIWSARDTSLNREVALKVVAPGWRDSDSARQKLQREARVTGRLEHPFIVPVYDIAEGPDGEPFYAMRMLRGPTLAEQIARHHRERSSGRVDPIERRRLLDNFKDVCLAVAYAHKQGVLHLDLKPQNVVLGEFGEVYLLDWGLSREVPGRSAGTDSSVEPPPSIGAGSRFGTPAYMSPEQAAGRPDLCDERTDVWGLGAIIYEILSGGPPHSESNYQGEEFFEEIQTVPRGLPPESSGGPMDSLASLCTTALSIDPAGRFETADAFAMEIERWLDEEPLHPYRNNIALFEARLKSSPGHHGISEGLARELFVLALVEGGLCRFAQASQTMARSKDIYQALCERFPAENRLRSALTIANFHHESILRRGGDLERAEAIKNKIEADLASMKQNAGLEENAEFSILQTYIGLIVSQDAIAFGQSEKPSDNHYPTRPESIHQAVDKIMRDVVDQRASARGLPPTLQGYGLSSAAPDAATPELASPDFSLSSPEKSDLTTIVADLNENVGLAGTGEDLDDIATSSESQLDKPLRPIQDYDYLLRRECQGGRFTTIRPLAKGGLSEVFIAIDNEFGREVALKRIKRENENDARSRARFFLEGYAMSRLDHEAVPTVFGMGIDEEDVPFIAMRLYKLIDLNQFLKPSNEVGHIESTTMSCGADRILRTALKCLVKACRAVHAAHTLGFVNRDIKPLNILLDESAEQVVVLDWGLVKIQGGFSQLAENSPRASGSIGLITPEFETLSGAVMGTPAFMSPEQACGSSTVAPASDIYSAGATLYFILARRPPSEKGALGEVLKRRRQGLYDPLSQTAPNAPLALCRISEKAMQLAPEDRYATISDFARDIENWLEGRPVSVYREGPLRRAARWATSWGSR